MRWLQKLQVLKNKKTNTTQQSMPICAGCQALIEDSQDCFQTVDDLWFHSKCIETETRLEREMMHRQSLHSIHTTEPTPNALFASVTCDACSLLIVGEDEENRKPGQIPLPGHDKHRLHKVCESLAKNWGITSPLPLATTPKHIRRRIDPWTWEQRLTVISGSFTDLWTLSRELTVNTHCSTRVRERYLDVLKGILGIADDVKATYMRLTRSDILPAEIDRPYSSLSAIIFDLQQDVVDFTDPVLTLRLTTAPNALKLIIRSLIYLTIQIEFALCDAKTSRLITTIIKDIINPPSTPTLNVPHAPSSPPSQTLMDELQSALYDDYTMLPTSRKSTSKKRTSISTARTHKSMTESIKQKMSKLSNLFKSFPSVMSRNRKPSDEDVHVVDSGYATPIDVSLELPSQPTLSFEDEMFRAFISLLPLRSIPGLHAVSEILESKGFNNLDEIEKCSVGELCERGFSSDEAFQIKKVVHGIMTADEGIKRMTWG